MLSSAMHEKCFTLTRPDLSCCKMTKYSGIINKFNNYKDFIEPQVLFKACVLNI